MSSSPKITRTPPPRNLSDYVLTKQVGLDLGFTKVPSNAYKQWPDNAGEPGNSAVSTGFSNPIDIGFNFFFNGVNYKRICALENGQAILLDPAYVAPVTPPNPYAGYFYLPEIYDNSLGVYYNSRIASTFGSSGLSPSENRHVVLAPWSDQMYTSFNKLDNVRAGAIYVSGADATTVRNLRYGLTVPDNNTLWDESEYAVRYANISTSEGLALSIRWDVVSGTATSTFDLARLKFELVLFENGTIQFRYAKRSKKNGNIPYRKPYVASGSMGASIGIFANWSGWDFRDFSVGLGYRDEERKIFENGGSIYDAGYSDTGTNLNNDTGTVPYSCNLDPINHWPASDLTFSVFNFSPPRQKRRTNKSVIRVRDSSSFVASDSSFFNDQKTVNFSNQKVQYPSMMPTSYKISNGSSTASAVNLLFKSGSIEITRSITPGLVDTILEDAILESNSRDKP